MRSRLARTLLDCLLLSVALTLAPGAFCQTDSKQLRKLVIGPLQPNVASTRTIGGTELHLYQVTVQAGQCATIQLEQRGTDVVLQLVGEHDSPIVAVDDAITSTGTERLEFVAEATSIYSIAIKPKVPSSTGSYEIRAEVRPANDTDRRLFEAWKLRTFANQLYDSDKAVDAIAPAQEALRLVSQALPDDDLRIALFRRDLGLIFHLAARSEQARTLLEQSLEVFTEKLGKEAPQTFFTQSRLGSVYEKLGDLSKAERLVSDALEVEERVLPDGDPLIAGTLKTLGIVYIDRHDAPRAEKQYFRALAIMDKAGLSDTVSYAQLLNNLGVAAVAQSKLDDAERYYRRSLEFDVSHYGPDSAALSYPLNNLGVLARRRRDYPAAEDYFKRALRIKEKAVGAQHPEYAAVLMNLSTVYRSEGSYEQSLKTEQQAVAIFEKDSEADDPDLISPLANLVSSYIALGDFNNAIKYQAQLEPALEREISMNLAIGSERQKLTFLSTMGERMDRTLSLNLRNDPTDDRAAALAATVLLQRKGRLLEAMTDNFAQLRRRASPEDQRLLDDLKATTVQLAQITLRRSQRFAPAERLKTLQELEQKKEKLEAVISRNNEEFRVKARPVTLENVCAALPPRTALIEFATYRPYDPKATDPEQFGARRYAAYVITAHSPPKGVDLGPSDVIDSALASFRAALQDPARHDASSLGRVVGEKIIDPIREALTGPTRLLISPDGQLDLIPFEALRDAAGNYLVEQYAISYLLSGRDLLRMQAPIESAEPPVILADPLFEKTGAVQLASARSGAYSASTLRSITTGTKLSEVYFAPLPGTRVEAARIHELFPDSKVLTGPNASRAAIQELSAPGILHIATHGFFLKDSSAAEMSGGGSNNTTDFENPLLRSGLALTNANLVRDGDNEGIFTALEAANLNLWGTKLVTLSACDTGMGEVRNGEGVYGLRRAFFMAGAQSMVMSLWPVSDYLTREMMVSYYTALKHGAGRADALRRVQLALIHRKDRRHPFYWASFIEAGEWANLAGRR
ncbi:MAG: CHAT domain-containing protein [Acidobacteria bacterium]|nr:CHAT domain-containing protein [Acidobacteriota bacterium]